jgi:regulator of CtrA degradation
MMESTSTRASERAAVSFAETFVTSDAFKALFKEGMALVENTAAYLDGEGRAEAKLLTRGPALAYASESMRLTTRLMQLASWLLLQRAVAEGEMTHSQARAQKSKLRLSNQDPVTGPDSFSALPGELQSLVAQSLRLQARIIHLDQLLESTEPAPPPESANVVASQQRMLLSAFGNAE